MYFEITYFEKNINLSACETARILKHKDVTVPQVPATFIHTIILANGNKVNIFTFILFVLLSVRKVH